MEIRLASNGEVMIWINYKKEQEVELIRKLVIDLIKNNKNLDILSNE